MSSYTFETSHDSPNFTAGRPISFPLPGIVFHHWDDPNRGATFDGVIATLCNPNRGASANYVVAVGRVACLVAPQNTAWCNGNWESNQRTISVELEPGASDATLETAAQLVATLIGNGVLARDCSAQGHRDVSDNPTSCPGEWAPRIGEIMARARQLLDGDTAEPPPPADDSDTDPAPVGDGWSWWQLDPGDTLWGISEATGVSVDRLLELNPELVSHEWQIPVDYVISLTQWGADHFDRNPFDEVSA